MNSLKQECKERFKIAFDSIRAASTDLTFILVVDDYALKILSYTIKMMELINYGVNLVQKLELKRKKFSKLEAVYLIHPDSYEKIVEDFEEDQNPQYGHIHILTLTKMSMHIMNELSKESKVNKRIKTLKELNLNFRLHSENEFLIGIDEKDTFSSSLRTEGIDSQVLMRKTIDQLTTVVTSMTEFYIVEILYSQAETSEKIALGVKQKLQKLFQNYKKLGVENYTSNAPQITFLILDRGYDAVSPLVRDFHYLPLLYDLKDVRNHQIEQANNKPTIILNEDDQIFVKYRYSHIAETLNGIGNDFQSFSKGHIGAKFEKNQDGEVKMEEMKEILKKIPHYTQSKDKYSFHMDMTASIMKTFEKQKFKMQGQLEQMLITQTNEDGKHFKHSELLKDLLEKIDTIPKNQDKARLLLIGLMCLDLKPKQKSALIEKFGALSNYDDLYKNLEMVCGHRSYHLPYRKSMKEETLILDRHRTKLEETVKAILSGGQTDLKYLRVGTDARNYKNQMKNVNNFGRAKLGSKKDKVKNKLIIFFGSAMGYNEIRSVAQFEKDWQIICGSHNFTTQKQYLNLINNLVLDEL